MKSTLEQFNELIGDDKESPIERLRLFCSIAMNNQDWLDVEPFFDALATQPQAPQGGGWQPIETAPKDGRTMLLGCSNSHKKWRTMRGQWMSEAYIDENWEDPDDATPGWYETVVEGDDIPNCWYITPTHWQPLPAAPTETPEAGK